jgi:hypothetical protein
LYIIDRIEGDVAVVEHGDDMLNIPLSELPKGVREGSVLRKKEGGGFEPDEAARKKRLKTLKDRFSSLLE